MARSENPYAHRMEEFFPFELSSLNQGVHLFSIVAITNYCKDIILKQYKFIILKFKRKTYQIVEDTFHLVALKNNPFPCLFQLLPATSIPWFMVLHHCHLCLCHHIPVSNSSVLASKLFEEK